MNKKFIDNFCIDEGLEEFKTMMVSDHNQRFVKNIKFVFALLDSENMSLNSI